jgi:hypothetical protein
VAYVCLACQSAADTQNLKLQRAQNKVLSATGKFPRCTMTRDLHVAFEIPNIRDTVQEVEKGTEFAGLEIGADEVYHSSICRCSFR